ncbi:MAG: helix-turn-helix transcriptional regulator [Candidatus Thorarchaeota archaeon]|nr:MAG: helix-turn-helix transcriptional regulator [Candidatus Thorarchaeota archaeon]
MSQEHEVRLENLEKVHKEAPEKAPSCAPYTARRQVIDDFLDHFQAAGPDVFTASIRTGVVLLLLKLDAACVCEIQCALDEPRQPLLSHHLREMKKAGWLNSERRGRWTYYSLEDKKRESMIRLIKFLGAE